ncbi:hypothetical protein [Sporosarcina limicola]|uniref:Uncharacterized protein n=1 Tax=Sporosarcina limicola TaxID=34101 RepID=A0A927MI61_9BACL|nr:hypothetical protein [Sporosarcina limicola]MBE1554241.1 hypothetical protein [Sporosarcina limicola]
MRGSKYIDLGLIIFMSYFAFTRFSNGQNGLGIMFTVLALMNVLTFVMKSKQGKEQTETK